MPKFVVHQHAHHGWTTNSYEADVFEEAARIDILESHSFLKEIVHKIDFSIIEGNLYYSVSYNGEEPRPYLNPFGDGFQRKGDYWFGGKIREGSSDDCLDCGGTGINHYYVWRQCWGCGDQELDGRGTGKNKLECVG